MENCKCIKNNAPPRVAAIHDLSSFGRCALTVVIPVLSVMGAQVVPLPTALMSTHTGGYDNIYMRNLSPDMSAMYEHWIKLGITFRAIYSGFILSSEQAEIIEKFRSVFRRPDTLVLTDPVFADDGVLYSTCDYKTVEYMKKLCRGSDIITPNLTEACMLCGEKYPQKPLPLEEARDFAKKLLGKLEELKAKNTVITGIKGERDGRQYMMNCGIDEDGYFETVQPRIPVSYPGTGELFASVVLGRLLKGDTFRASCEKSAFYTCETIKKTLSLGTPVREGVALEVCLGALAE